MAPDHWFLAACGFSGEADGFVCELYGMHALANDGVPNLMLAGTHTCSLVMAAAHDFQDQAYLSCSFVTLWAYSELLDTQ